MPARAPKRTKLDVNDAQIPCEVCADVGNCDSAASIDSLSNDRLFRKCYETILAKEVVTMAIPCSQRLTRVGQR